MWTYNLVMSRRYVANDSPLRLLTNLRAMLLRGYSRDDLGADFGAGLILGVVALPLSMALAIAAGAPPENGLFTAIVGGAVIAVFGGSMLSVSGPTAAFVILLAPVTAKYGLQGLLIASLMAGFFLIVMGLMRLGGLIQFVPYPVTTGFTAGIAVVIAILQLGDFIGIGTLEGERIWDRLGYLVESLPDIRWPDVVVGLATLAILIVFPRFTRRIPVPLVALLAAAGLGVALAAMGDDVVTINSRFGGIPAIPPLPGLPWADGGVTVEMVKSLIPTAAAIAALGAIESLLCAVVADGMASAKYDPDSELVGLGIGNIVAPFFGGFAATGAIARTATGIRSGARTPVAVIVHSLFLLLSILLLSRLLGYIPMAGMAALLLFVAWNMSDAGSVVRIVRTAPRSDVIVFLVCFGLTITFDMVIAVGVGVILAALLFMRRMVEISGATLIGGKHDHSVSGLPPGVIFYDVAGPLFFGAAQKALDALTIIDGDVHTVIIDLEDVPAIDVTGLVALSSSIEHLNRASIKVVLTGVQPQPQRAFTKAGIVDRPGLLEVSTDVDLTLGRFAV